MSSDPVKANAMYLPLAEKLMEKYVIEKRSETEAGMEREERGGRTEGKGGMEKRSGRKERDRGMRDGEKIRGRGRQRGREE